MQKIWYIMAKIKITEFGDKYCPPCKAQKPIMKKLRKKHPDWTIKEIDVEKDTGGLADKNNVMTVPTFIVEKDGKKKKWSGGPVGVREMEEIIRGM